MAVIQECLLQCFDEDDQHCLVQNTPRVLEVAVAAWLLAADGTMLHQTALQPWQWEQGAAGRSGHIQRNTSLCMKQ